MTSQPIQVTTEPLDGLRMVANAQPPAQGPGPESSTGGQGWDHGVPPALPHPPPVFGGLPAAEPGPPADLLVEGAGIFRADGGGDYVSGTIAGEGRLLRYPTTLTTLSVGLRFYLDDGSLVEVVSLAPLPETE